MTDGIFEKLAKLRALYPEEVKRIQAEEDHITAVLKKQEYYQNPETQQLIALCRTDILAARKKLALERNLPEGARAELWHIIDARSWFLEMVVKDYASELAQIEQQLDHDLSE